MAGPGLPGQFGLLAHAVLGEVRLAESNSPGKLTSERAVPDVVGMFIWPQIDDQRQRSLVTAGARTTNTSEAVYVLTAVSA